MDNKLTTISVKLETKKLLELFRDYPKEPLRDVLERILKKYKENK